MPQMLDVKLLWSEQKPSARQELLSTVRSTITMELMTMSTSAGKWLT